MKLTLTAYSLMKGRHLKRLILACNFIVLISLMAVINVAASVHSEGKKISIKAEDIQLRDLFREIENNSDYAFFFSDQYSELDKKVTLEINEGSINSILEQLLEKTYLDYQILDNNFIVIKPRATQQENVVKGKVVDGEGNGIPGVKVGVKGTEKGVITDIDGNFSISVSDPATILVFTSLGYNEEEIAVGTQTVINLTMIETLEELNEVVVVGYGVQKKSDITGSISSVDEESLREVPASNLSQVLQGKAAGLEILSTSTRPGSAPQMRIRGNRSLSASNDPLLVLDGIPFDGSINDMNPDDITSVDILKDASATAIYGSRGSNGVILITTKRGKAGKSQVSLNSYYGVSQVARKYEVYNAAEFQDLREQSGYLVEGETFLPVEEQSIALGRETDWQDLLYKDGYTTNHDLSVYGGSENAQYSISGGYHKSTTVLPGQDFTRFSLRATVDQNIGKRIKIGLNTMNSYGITNGETVSPMYNILTMSPLSIPYDSTGSIITQPVVGADDMYNPLLINNQETWKEQRIRIRSFNSLFAEVQLLEGLKYRINIGLDIRQGKYGRYFGSTTPMLSGRQSAIKIDNSSEYGYTIENILSYEKTFAEKHKVFLTGLYSVQEYQVDSTSMRAQDVIADYIQYYNPALANTFAGANGGYLKWDILSYMGRVNYGYDDRYLVTFTLRADGSSRLAPGNQWHYYPAVALAWNATNESFLKDNSVLTNLKLRAGYGQTSNTAIAPYSTLASLAQEPYSFGDQGVYGYYSSRVANYNLGWEYTSTINAGIDFGILRNRINGSLEIYKQTTTDILLSKSLVPSGGYSLSGSDSRFLTNIGETQNKGLEFNVNTAILSNPDGLNWDLNLNIFLNREEIVALADTSLEDVGNQWFVGHPIDVIYDYKKIGIWQSEDSLEARSYGQNVGEIRVEDVDTNGSISGTDRQIIGTYQPKFQGGFSTRFEYKGFDLTVVVFARIGGMLVSTIHQPSSYLNMLQGRRSGIRVDYWTRDNRDGTYPKPTLNQDNPIYGSTLGYFDATFVKVRSINLGYNIPQNWISKTGAQSVRVYFTVQNPFILFSPYVKAGGVDPEPNSTGDGRLGNIVPDRALTVALNTPPTRSFIFGLNLKF